MLHTIYVCVLSQSLGAGSQPNGAVWNKCPGFDFGVYIEFSDVFGDLRATYSLLVKTLNRGPVSYQEARLRTI